MSDDEVEEKLHRPRLARQLMYVATNSGFYREKLIQAGVDPLGSAADIDQFQNWPFTTKAEILDEQIRYPPFGRLTACRQDIIRVHMTSGTTGRPFYIALTAADVAANIESGRRAFLCAGMAPGDLVVHCLNYCLWAGGLTDHLSLEATQASVIPFGVGHTKRLIELIRELRPNAISCTPSYMSRLEVVLQDEFHMSPRDLGLKKGFFGGEGGLQDPDVRKALEQTWGMRAIDANYGMADVLSIFGSECEYRLGLHFHGRGLLYVELIDPDSGKVLPLQEGQEGELVLSNLVREAQPLIRFRTGDVVKIMGTGKCQCGRNSFRFVVVGRSDQMIVVQGVNVYATAVKGILARNRERFSGVFEIVLENPPPIRTPLIRVERSENRSTRDDDENAKYLVDVCRERLQFTPRIELVPYGCLPRTDGKTRYIRRTYEERE